MDKKVVYRKLEIANNTYYQLYKICDNLDNYEKIGEYEDRKNNDYFYHTVDLEEVKDYEKMRYFVFEEVDNNLELINDPIKITSVRNMFAKYFRDFDLVPKNNFDIEELEYLINEKVKFHEQEVREILNVIKSNLDIADSKILSEEKEKLIHNILLYGPSGYGKSTILKSILNNTDNPCVLMELVPNFSENLNRLIVTLTSSALGNMALAENGIVLIKDNFDDFPVTDENKNPLIYLDNLMSTKQAILQDNDDEKIIFDLSKITFIVEKTTYNNDKGCLYDEGFDGVLLDNFQNIICIDKLTNEEIKEVILSDSNNIIKAYSDVLSGLNRQLKISDSTLELLIDKISNCEGGITLINSILKSLIISKWSNSLVEITDDDVLRETLKYESNSSSKVETKESTELVKVQDDFSNDENTLKIDNNMIRGDFQKKLLYLMGYIKGQDEPLKKILYHVYMNDIVQNSNLNSRNKAKYIEHILIRGDAGTGKTYISEMVGSVFKNKPVVCVDAKQYTAAGFVGKSVEDMLVQLYYAANCDEKKAQKGILIIDEFDKLADNGSVNSGVGRGDVQDSLLKILDGKVFNLEIKEGPYVKNVDFDTHELTVICAGAFEGLDKIKKERLIKKNKPKAIGFASNKENEEYIDNNYSIDDMKEFGMHTQVLRRIPVQLDLNKLKVEDYKNIMLNSKDSQFLTKLKKLELFGVKVEYDNEFIDAFVNKAYHMGFGVSSLNILSESILGVVQENILLSNYEKVILTKEAVEDPYKIIFINKGDSKQKKIKL